MEKDGLGREIRALRKKAGMGLRELGRLAEVSPASLTAIEKGASSPTLATLHKILRAMGTSFAEFFSQPAQMPVFRRAEMSSARDRHRRYTFLLPRGSGLRFDMVDEVISAGDVKAEWEVHDFDVGGVIMSGGPGRLEIEGQGEWTIRSGDSFYVKAGLRHRLVNTGKREIKQVTVMQPARY